MKKSTITCLVGMIFTSSVLASENITLDDVLVQANRFEHKDTEVTYASEIHTAKQIESSGAATLYDFLTQQTSLNVLSSYGNKSTPSINLRGFGGENGSQNVVITVDGQRLNNIDGQPQLLGAIPLSNIERIEISKGSGSVIYGDGATAGAIQIYTKNKTGVSISSSFGNFGQQYHYVNAGFSEQHLDLSVNLAHDSYDGFSKPDNTGHKDEFNSNTQNIKLKIKPSDSLRFLVEGTNSRNADRYVNYLSESQFKADPRQSGTPDYTHQVLESKQWRAGIEYDITSKLKIKATHFEEDKLSDYVNFFSKSTYNYNSNDMALTFNGDTFNIVGGLQSFNGDRSTSDNITSKDNQAVFIQTEFHPDWLLDALAFSAGARDEKVKYRYSPTIGNSLKSSEALNAWDIGVKYRFNNSLTTFANYNKAYQAPDIDRFFNWGGGFNGFISPANVKTFNLGFNHVLPNNHLKTTAFYSDLKNEIFYFQDNINFVYRNTNIDESHKYGLEVQDSYKFNSQLNTSIIYNYTRAIIDKENNGGGAFNGKNLPGVPTHTLVANINYKFLDHANINLNQTWRSKAYAYNDFANNALQKQGNYESTNLGLSYQYNNLQVFSSISNLFEHRNSIQVADDTIYPVDFVRTWRIGMKVDF